MLEKQNFKGKKNNNKGIKTLSHELSPTVH